MGKEHPDYPTDGIRMCIGRWNPTKRKLVIRRVPVTAAQYRDFLGGAPAKEAFPHLSEKAIRFIESGEL